MHNSDALKVLNKTLKICGKEVGAGEQIECKDALSKNDSNMRVNDEKVKKIFIGGLPPDATEGALRSPDALADYFGKFGEIKTCRIIYKHDSQVSRGFGFIIFQHKEAADAVIQHRNEHFIGGKWVDCKSAILRQEMKLPTPTHERERKPKPQKRMHGRSGHQQPAYAQQSAHYSGPTSHHGHGRQQSYGQAHGQSPAQGYQYTTSQRPGPRHDSYQAGGRYQQQFDPGARGYLQDNRSGSGYNYSEPKKASSGEGQKNSSSSQTTKKKEGSSNFDKSDAALAPQLSPPQLGPLLPGARRLPAGNGASPKKMPLPVNEVPEYPDEEYPVFGGGFLGPTASLPIAHNYLPVGDSPVNFRPSYPVFQPAGGDRFGEFGGFFTPQAQPYGQQVYQGAQKTAKGKLQDRDFLTPTYKPQETGFSSYFERVVGSRKPPNEEDYDDEL